MFKTLKSMWASLLLKVGARRPHAAASEAPVCTDREPEEERAARERLREIARSIPALPLVAAERTAARVAAREAARRSVAAAPAVRSHGETREGRAETVEESTGASVPAPHEMPIAMVVPGSPASVMLEEGRS